MSPRYEETQEREGGYVRVRGEKWRERMSLLHSLLSFMKEETIERAVHTIWCTPTIGLFVTAASVLAALQATPRHAPIPKQISGIQEKHREH